MRTRQRRAVPRAAGAPTPPSTRGAVAPAAIAAGNGPLMLVNRVKLQAIIVPEYMQHGPRAQRARA